MTDEKENSNDNLTVEITWKGVAITFMILFFGLLLYYIITETYTFEKSPCTALAKQIQDDKALWTQHCGFIINGTMKGNTPTSDTIVRVPQMQIDCDALKRLTNETGDDSYSLVSARFNCDMLSRMTNYARWE